MNRTLGHRAPLLWLILPFMGGLAVGRAFPAPWELLIPAGLLALVSLAAARRFPVLWAAGLAAAMALAGDASYALHRRPPPAPSRTPVRETALWLRLDQVAPPKPGRKVASGVATIVRAEPPRGDLAGRRIYFSLALGSSEEPVRSAVIRATGRLARAPRHPAAGTFGAYLTDLGLDFSLMRGRILAEERPANPYRRFCERLGERMYALLGAGLERRPDLAAVYRAMMLGRKGDLAPGQRRLFLQSGTMHLFAINGLHIGVVAVALHALFALARLPRAAASAAVLAVLWLDVDTTGDSPSAVRAFLMIAVLEAAGAWRRPGNSLSALASSALAVLLADPMDFFGASFEMSYGVVVGIIALGLPLAERLRTGGTPVPTSPNGAAAGMRDHLWGALGVGVGAGLVSAVTGIEFFGLIAPVGIAANLVLAPLAALAIVAGFTSLVCGLAGAAAAGRLCNHAAGTVIAAVEALMRLLTRLPGAYYPAHFRAAWIGPVTLAFLLASCLTGYALGWRRERGGFWPPVAVVAIALVFGVNYRP